MYRIYDMAASGRMQYDYKQTNKASIHEYFIPVMGVSRVGLS